jgi:two-component system, response regulator YesN
MWRVLLVEDEPFVRRTLIKQIPWQECGFELAAEAENGMEAMVFMSHEQPHLVITDIMMPGMDGLELLRQGKAAYGSTKFVMLTCVNEFEYARQALELGASGYLLKLSADRDALKKLLLKIDGELKEEKDRTLEHRSLRFSAAYGKLWSRIESLDAELPGAQEQELPNDALSYVSVVSILHGSDKKPEDMAAAEEQLRGLLNKGDELHRYAGRGLTHFFCWTRKELYIPDNLLTAEFGASKPSPKEELVQAWRDALLRINRVWYDQTPYAGLEERCIQGEGLLWKKERELLRVLEQTELSRALGILEELWEDMRSHGLVVSQVQYLAERLDRQFGRMYNRQGKPDHEWLCVKRHDALGRELAVRLEQMVKASLYQAEALTDRADINSIIQYITYNIAENITLKSMAQMVNMDENYISVLFRKKTGETLINYVQKCRVEKAKKLLLESELSIPEIYTQIGFANENYFFRIFKRWTGETPGKFRSRVRGR